MKEIDSDKIEYVIEHLRNPGSLSDHDFQEWLGKDENFQIFSEVFRNREAFLYQEYAARIDVGCELKRCVSLIRARRIRTRRIRYWSAAAACIALFFSSWFLFVNKDVSQKPTFVQAVPVGKKCAELVLADGKHLSLDKTSLEIKDIRGIVVKNDSLTGLTYKGVEQGEDSAVCHTLKVPASADYYVQLSDGTKVWLNCESTLRYPVNFSKNERRVFLDGEAYFDVKKAGEWPFVVVAGRMDIRVTGTEFNVKSYAREALVHTTLVSGSVLVNQQRLQPSQQFLMNKETCQVTVQSIDPKIYTGWVEGMFVFKKQRLEEVMSDLARWYQIEVFYMNPSVKDIRFSGNLGRYETLDNVLQAIETTGKVSILRKGNSITISAK